MSWKWNPSPTYIEKLNETLFRLLGARISGRVFPFTRLCSDDFFPAPMIYFQVTVLYTPHNGWPPPWTVWNTRNRANICKLLGICKKEVRHLAIYDSLILLIDVKNIQLTKWKPTTILNKLTSVNFPSQVFFSRKYRRKIRHDRS